MRILAITNMYPSTAHPSQGVFVEEQIKGLRSIGLEVGVLVVDRRQEGPAAYYRMRSKVRNVVARFEPDVIHVMYGGVMADQIVRHHHVCPMVVTFQGSDLLGENLSGWTRKMISQYGVRCSKRAARGAEAVIVVARILAGVLRGVAEADKVRVIPCGIDLERFKPMDSLSCKQRLGWNPHSFHVLFASSNGDPVKRPRLASAAIEHLKGPDRLVELHFMRGIPNAEVPMWLGASDAFLLTSLQEGSPTIVKEALACGLPLVSTDVGDVAERIRGIEGCYLASADPAELARKLALVWQRRQRLDCRSRLEELSIVSVARNLKRCYEDITSRSRGTQSLSSRDRCSAKFVFETNPSPIAAATPPGIIAAVEKMPERLGAAHGFQPTPAPS
jgi:teichuronic acid biosynthesis glycosyltransferase TuaC